MRPQRGPAPLLERHHGKGNHSYRLPSSERPSIASPKEPQPHRETGRNLRSKDVERIIPASAALFDYHSRRGVLGRMESGVCWVSSAQDARSI